MSRSCRFPTSCHAVRPSSATVGSERWRKGLAAGMPQLTMPMGFDQPDNATRLQAVRCGALGRAVEVRWRARRGERSAICSATAAPRSNCRRWSDQIRAHNAIEETCDLLEQLS